MNRIEFAAALTTLLMYMQNQGDHPIIDYALRSAEEQRRLFDKGLSKCDGIKKISKHQAGLAADIYLIENGKMAEWGPRAQKYHEFWEGLGGRPMISWDIGHFEG